MNVRVLWDVRKMSNISLQFFHINGTLPSKRWILCPHPLNQDGLMTWTHRVRRK